MTTPRILAALLTAALLIAGLTALSCAAPPPPEPLPTYTPYPTQSPLPTLTPFPTWTPAPTATPYPTATAYPTPTALPTWTPAPTYTPYPTYTPRPRPTNTPRLTATRRPTFTPRPRPTATPAASWQTYRHNVDRDAGAECDTRPNFAIELPAQWATEFTSCIYAWFTTRDETARLEIEIAYLPYYSASPRAALAELVEDYGSDHTFEDLLGNTWQTVVNSTETIEHRGRTAIYQTLTYTPELSFLYCTTDAQRLIILSQSWRSHRQKAVLAEVSQCQISDRHDADLTRILDSFRLIAPY